MMSALRIAKRAGGLLALWAAVFAAAECAPTVCVAAGPAPPGQARKADAATAKGPTRGAVEKLFNLGLKNTPAALAEARAQYERLKQGDPEDRRIDYAYGVVLVNQHRYRDALPLLARYLEANPRDVAAARVRFWALVQDRRYEEFLDEAADLAGRFPKSGEPQAESLVTARLLGTLFGFLQNTRPRGPERETRLARTNQVLAHLAAPYREAFDGGRTDVADRLAALEAERDARQHQAARKKADIAADAKEMLSDEKTRIAETTETIEDKTRQLSAVERELATARKQLVARQAERSKVAAQIIVLQAQAQQLQTQAAYVSGRRSASPATTRAQLTVVLNSLVGLGEQAAGLDLAIRQLQARCAGLLGKGQEANRSIDESEAAARTAQRRANIAERQIRSVESKPPPRPGVLVGKMALLSSYAPFPYGQEQKSVLAWFTR